MYMVIDPPGVELAHSRFSTPRQTGFIVTVLPSTFVTHHLLDTDMFLGSYQFGARPVVQRRGSIGIAGLGPAQP
jgi:hypothetical protein